MSGEVPAYGLWFLVVINAGIFILFAFSGTSYRRYADRVPAFVPRLFPTTEDVA